MLVLPLLSYYKWCLGGVFGGLIIDGQCRPWAAGHGPTTCLSTTSMLVSPCGSNDRLPTPVHVTGPWSLGAGGEGGREGGRGGGREGGREGGRGGREGGWEGGGREGGRGNEGVRWEGEREEGGWRRHGRRRHWWRSPPP